MSYLFQVAAKNKRDKIISFIEAGSSHSLLINGRGKIWAWGSNASGQLGDNTTVSKSSPVSVAGTIKTFCSISASNHSLALDKNGRAWSWGANSSGQLGDNTVTQKSTPISVLGIVKTFCKIDAGGNCSLAIDKNGRAWAWGLNNNGQLGDNTITQRNTPVSVLGTVKTFCTIRAGGNHSLAIDKNGRVWAWGFNSNGQLGDNTIISKRTPVSILGTVKTFCSINAGNHSLALDKNGRLWSWGYNLFGNLGDNTTVSKSTPVSVLGTVKTFCAISSKNNHSLAIDKNGKVWAWGLNSNNQLGDGTSVSRLTPVSILGATKTFCVIRAGNGHSLAIDKNGKVWAWGTNLLGVIGNNTVNSKITPINIIGATKTFCSISAANADSLALDKNGIVWAWGQNSFGQLGVNTLIDNGTPISISGVKKTFCHISAGTSFSLAIDKNGGVWAWGSNASGQLGDNTIVSKSTPVSILGSTKTFCTIKAGLSHSLTIDKNGRAWAWGNNAFGQLGDSSTLSKRTPVSILGAVKTFCSIAASNHSLAIDKNGRVWGWGNNSNGQLGDNTITQRNTPVSILGAIKTFCAIGAGLTHSLAIDKNGRLWAWGINGSGQLGDNTITQKSTPVSVLGTVKTFCKISAASNSSFAIDKNGRLWAWGGNSSGQLGDNTKISKSTPISVLGAAKTFCQIAAGTNHSVAIDKNGRVWAWGLNSYGELGNNELANTPVRICNI